MLVLLVKAAMIPIGAGLIWGSESGARQLVQSRRVPGWMSVRVVRGFHIVGGIFSMAAGIKLLLWP